MKRTIKITIDDGKKLSKTKSYESDAERMTRNINAYTRKAFGEGSRGPRRDHVKHYNEDLKKITSGRSSGNSVERFNKRQKDL